jgi:hypothetical protein
VRGMREAPGGLRTTTAFRWVKALCRAIGEVLGKWPPDGVVALRRSSRRLPWSQRVPLALQPGEALHRGLRSAARQ